MATSIRCSVCPKGEGTCYCPGCKAYFCNKDFPDHRRMLVDRLDELTEDRNELQEKINETSSQEHSGNSLLSQINAWQEDTIQKVNQAAEQARRQVFKIMNSKWQKINGQFRTLSQELGQLRQTKGVLEQDLSRLKNQVEQLHKSLEKFSQPPAIELNTTGSESIVWHRMIYVKDTSASSAQEQDSSQLRENNSAHPVYEQERERQQRRDQNRGIVVGSAYSSNSQQQYNDGRGGRESGIKQQTNRNDQERVENRFNVNSVRQLQSNDKRSQGPLAMSLAPKVTWTKGSGIEKKPEEDRSFTNRASKPPTGPVQSFKGKLGSSQGGANYPLQHQPSCELAHKNRGGRANSPINTADSPSMENSREDSHNVSREQSRNVSYESNVSLPTQMSKSSVNESSTVINPDPFVDASFSNQYEPLTPQSKENNSPRADPQLVRLFKSVNDQGTAVNDPEIITYIREHMDPTEKFYIRNIVLSYLEACLINRDPQKKIQEDIAKRRMTVLNAIIEHKLEAEIQAVYAIQNFVNKLEHPSKMARLLFDIFYDGECVSEEAFFEWLNHPDQSETEGHAGIKMSTKDFFAWLQADIEVEEDEEEEN